MPAGFIFDVVYNPTLVRLTVVPGMDLPGDYNLDGTVDAADYVVWRKSDGTQGGYDAWRNNYGRTAAAAAATSTANIAVPEANSLLLGFTGLFVLFTHRFRPCLRVMHAHPESALAA